MRSSRTSAASAVCTLDAHAEPVPLARFRRQQRLAAFEDDGAQDAALGEGQALPDGVEDRVLLAEQPPQRRVQVLDADAPPPRRGHVVPGLVREPLHVVGQVAGEFDDGERRIRLRD